MKIKVGQWVRMILHDKVIMRQIQNEIDKKHISNYNVVIKVTDTPQELIEVGDLVQLPHSKSFEYVLYVNNYEVDTNIPRDNLILRNTIIKILTPNTNGGYDLQWKKS
jgi:translation initiation factor 2 beta subunit (eIF-2beta)/eIF-5